MDAHEREAHRLIAAGADPRRAGPAAAAHFGLPRTPSPAQTMAVGGVLGLLAAVMVASLLLPIFDLRVTPASNLQPPSPARSQVDAALSSLPETEREAALDDLSKLVPLLHDPVAQHLVRVLHALPTDERQALAAEPQLGHLLGGIAALTGQQRISLLAVMDDPHSVELLDVMRTLDPLSASVLKRWRLSTYGQRQVLANVLSILNEPDDGRFRRMVAAYRYAAPSLISLLDTRLAHCDFSDKGACR